VSTDKERKTSGSGEPFQFVPEVSIDKERKPPAPLVNEKIAKKKRTVKHDAPDAV
jgi:hypothetical protein